MVDPAADRGLQRLAEVLGGLARRGVDEVDVDVREADGACVLDRLDGAARRVRALEDGEHVRRDALHAERHAGEAVRTQRGERLERDRVGVGLGGHLGVARQPELVADRGEDAAQVAGREQGRRTASDEHRRHRDVAVAEHASREAHLGDGLVGVGRAADARTELVGGVGVEVAVAAPGRAVRHVHVDAERRRPEARESRRRKRTVERRRLPRRRQRRHPPTLTSASDPVRTRVTDQRVATRVRMQPFDQLLAFEAAGVRSRSTCSGGRRRSWSRRPCA